MSLFCSGFNTFSSTTPIILYLLRLRMLVSVTEKYLSIDSEKFLKTFVICVTVFYCSDIKTNKNFSCIIFGFINK